MARERGIWDRDFERGYVPGTESSDKEHEEYRRWNASGGRVATVSPVPDAIAMPSMTLQEYFAGQALAGLSSQTIEDKYNGSCWEDEGGMNPERVAAIAYGARQLADALIAELAKTRD
jgi:hypothetical protein